MTDWNTIRTFTTARFTVSLAWSWEDCPDLTWDESGETQAKCESGEWGVYTYRVRVCLDGNEIACDYLGNSVYADPVEFSREHLGINRTGCGCYFSDMLRTATDQARKMLCNAPRLRCA